MGTTGRPLIVRIRNWVGDVVLGLPALRLLESHGYAPHIVARGKWAPALLAGYPWPVAVQPQGLRTKVAQLRELSRLCRQADTGFARRENAVLLPVSFSSALEMRLAGLRAVGVAKEGRSLMLARSEPWATHGHELERYWDVACRFLRVQLPPPREIGFQVSPAKADAAAQLLAAQGIASPFIMICPFAAGRAATADKAPKKWPAFAEFVREAPARLGLSLVVYPGPGEHGEAHTLYPAACLLEGADLAIYAALLQRAALVVANDTGPAHMAGALGRPVISVLGPTEAGRWAPWGSQVHVLQKPRDGGTVVWPSAEEALALAQRLLAHGG
jgi:heptosyltransferase-2